jgi:uncharacterized protein
MPSGMRAISGIATSIAAFIDRFRRGPVNEAVRVTSFAGFERDFGGIDATSEASYGIQQFFLNGGREAYVVRVGTESGWLTETALRGLRGAKTGLFALDDADPFNILCVPAAASLDDVGMRSFYAAAEAYCEERRTFLIIDIPERVNHFDRMQTWLTQNAALRHRNAAVYFPRLFVPDPAKHGRVRNIGASGTMAGVYAATDVARGVWRAPAGTDAILQGVLDLAYPVTDRENELLSALGVNCLRNLPDVGNVAWGARTLAVDDQQAPDRKYISVRRLALFIEESLYRGMSWVVFEPNDESLWAKIRRHVGAFTQNLFRQGAFQGGTSEEAYFVKCDRETMTQSDIDCGMVNVLVGFAPLKPAEFVIIRIQQKAGQISP